MLPISVITDTLNLAEAAIPFFTDKSEKERKQRVNILFRRLYAETRSNLDILDLVKKDNLKKDWLKSVKTIAPLLKNEYASLVLLGTDNCFKEIKLIQSDLYETWQVNQDESSEDNDLFENPENFKQAVSFCVNKIEILKSYATIDEKNVDLFTKLVLSKRLANIYNYSKIIKKSLSNYFASYSN